MAISYSLKITQMDVEPQVEGQENVVVSAHWAYTGTENGKSVGYGNKTSFTYVPGSPFTPYADLTEEQVVSWVMAAWSEKEKATYDDIVANALKSQAEPLPWGNSPVASPAVEG